MNDNRIIMPKMPIITDSLMRYSNKQLLLSPPSGGTESSEIVHMYFIVCNGQSVKTHIKNIFSQDLSTAGNFGRKQQLQRRFPERFPVSPWKRVYTPGFRLVQCPRGALLFPPGKRSYIRLLQCPSCSALATQLLACT